MADVRFIVFQPWHLKLFSAGDYYLAIPVDQNTRAALYRQVQGFTVLIDDEIAFIIGVVPLWQGVGEVTMVPSNLFYKYPKLCLRTCKELLQLAMDTFKLHRLQGTTLASCPKHGRFMESAGFNLDGFLPQYGPGQEDMFMYSYVRAN